MWIPVSFRTTTLNSQDKKYLTYSNIFKILNSRPDSIKNYLWNTLKHSPRFNLQICNRLVGCWDAHRGILDGPGHRKNRRQSHLYCSETLQNTPTNFIFKNLSRVYCLTYTFCPNSLNLHLHFYTLHREVI